MDTRDDAGIGQRNGTPGGAGKELNHSGKSPVLPSLSVDEIMWQVRAELNRLRRRHATGASASTDPRHFDPSMPSWTTAVPQLVIKDKYHLSELLAFSDVNFIDAAYRAILHRDPDERGFNHYLQALRGGGSPKVLILRDFLETKEGQATGVRIQGMFLPALLDKWRRKKLVGPVIAWVHGLLRLGTQADRQATHEAKNDQEISELGHLVNEVSEYLMHRIVAIEAQFTGQVAPGEFDALKDEHASINLRVARLETELERALAESRTKGTPGPLDSFSAAVEDHFRGNRSDFRAHIESYLELVRAAGAGTPDAPIVDIGCGRGDWLELLRECGLIGRGIEINRAFIDSCRARELDVLEADAIEALRGMLDGSAGAITSMHLIEHLPFDLAIALLDEARRVLRPQGLVIIETLNPENFSVGNHWSYLNSNLRNPLPPVALRWIVEARGFTDVRIERLVPVRDHNAPKSVSMDVPGAEAVNALLASISAPMDYAIIGKRP
jgi:SAM-dependent methyltransferase